MCLYHYEPSRTTEYPRKLLAGYTGFLQTDAFRVYKLVAGEEPGITLVGCWAHVRRRFFEATKGSKKASAAHEGLGFVRALYRIQNELCALNLTDDEFLRRRREATEPHLEKFRTWLTRKSESVIPKSLLGKAVAYALAEGDALVHYLDHPDLTPDNNAAENAIRPFVVGRKNWGSRAARLARDLGQPPRRRCLLRHLLTHRDGKAQRARALRLPLLPVLQGAYHPRRGRLG